MKLITKLATQLLAEAIETRVRETIIAVTDRAVPDEIHVQAELESLTVGEDVITATVWASIPVSFCQQLRESRSVVAAVFDHDAAPASTPGWVYESARLIVEIGPEGMYVTSIRINDREMVRGGISALGRDIVSIRSNHPGQA